MILDLFGDPVPSNFGERGRPQHIPTDQNRNRVKFLLALGWGNDRIASSLDISAPTFRKYYFSEIEDRAKFRDKMIARFGMRLWEQVEAGNVGAMREFQKFMDRNDLMNFGQVLPAPGAAAAEDKPEAVGKKEAALLAARTPDASTPLGELMARRQSGSGLNS